MLNLTAACNHRGEGSTATKRVSVACLVGLLALAWSLVGPLAVGTAQAEPAPTCEAHLTPSLGGSCGDHKLELKLTNRYRVEFWDAFAGSDDSFHGLRTRVSAKYSYRDGVTLFGELQDARIWGLDSDTSGAGSLYRKWGGSRHMKKAQTTEMRQFWAEIRPIEGLSLRAGRQDIKLGTQALYKEAAWKYLKIARASQRLVGTVGWTNVERSNDAVSGAYDTEDYHFYGFAGKPTTGVFESENAYETQDDIVYGGVSVTAKRGTWFDNTEVRPFFLGYKDDRAERSGGQPDGKVEIYTLGFSAIGVYPVGPGNFDLLLWGAGQAGNFNDDDHLAYALIGEAGYQFTDVWSSPWFRAGVNFASGDSNAGGGDHNTFFNMLPTNHLYYGFADQLAFQNLVDLIAQVKLKPHPRVGLNVMFHKFWMANSDDAQYFGTGAFNRENFGYGGNKAGANDFGEELDLVLDVKVHDHVSVQAGYARLWGGEIIRNQINIGERTKRDLDFGYLQVVFSY